MACFVNEPKRYLFPVESAATGLFCFFLAVRDFRSTGEYPTMSHRLSLLMNENKECKDNNYFIFKKL